MEYPTGKLSSQSALLLGTGLLTLLLGMASYRLIAQEPDTPAPPGEKTKETTGKPSAATKIKRESLRYGGKNFDQWRVELETELKPEIRADGLTALAAFGANGYGPEATRTVLELMKGYELETNVVKDRAVIDAAFAAITKIGDSAVPILWESLQSDNRRVRTFAITSLQHDNRNAQPHIADLLKAARDEDYMVRQTALGLLAQIEDKPKSYVPVLLECLKDKEGDIRGIALRILQAMHLEAAEIMPVLKKALKDRYISVKGTAVEMAGSYGAKAKPVVPELLELLDKHKNALECFEVIEALAAIGPAAKEALPKLRKLRDEPIATHTVSTSGRNVNIGQLIGQTIKKIEGE